MSDQDIAEFIKDNSRDTHQLIGSGKKAHAAMTVDIVEMFYAPIHYDRTAYPDAPFTYEAVHKSYLAFKKTPTTKGWNMIILDQIK